MHLLEDKAPELQTMQGKVVPPQTTLGLPPPAALGSWGAAAHLTLPLCVSFSTLTVIVSPQNKYLMLLLSLHLIKMYRICAVNSNETNKTRAPSLEGIRCE